MNRRLEGNIPRATRESAPEEEAPTEIVESQQIKNILLQLGYAVDSTSDSTHLLTQKLLTDIRGKYQGENDPKKKAEIKDLTEKLILLHNQNITKNKKIPDVVIANTVIVQEQEEKIENDSSNTDLELEDREDELVPTRSGDVLIDKAGVPLTYDDVDYTSTEENQGLFEPEGLFKNENDEPDVVEEDKVVELNTGNKPTIADPKGKVFNMRGEDITGQIATEQTAASENRAKSVEEDDEISEAVVVEIDIIENLRSFQENIRKLQEDIAKMKEQARQLDQQEKNLWNTITRSIRSLFAPKPEQKNSADASQLQKSEETIKELESKIQASENELNDLIQKAGEISAQIANETIRLQKDVEANVNRERGPQSKDLEKRTLEDLQKERNERQKRIEDLTKTESFVPDSATSFVRETLTALRVNEKTIDAYVPKSQTPPGELHRKINTFFENLHNSMMENPEAVAAMKTEVEPQVQAKIDLFIDTLQNQNVDLDVDGLEMIVEAAREKYTKEAIENYISPQESQAIEDLESIRTLDIAIKRAEILKQLDLEPEYGYVTFAHAQQAMDKKLKSVKPESKAVVQEALNQNIKLLGSLQKELGSRQKDENVPSFKTETKLQRILKEENGIASIPETPQPKRSRESMSQNRGERDADQIRADIISDSELAMNPGIQDAIEEFEKLLSEKAKVQYDAFRLLGVDKAQVENQKLYAQKKEALAKLREQENTGDIIKNKNNQKDLENQLKELQRIIQGGVKEGTSRILDVESRRKGIFDMINNIITVNTKVGSEERKLLKEKLVDLQNLIDDARTRKKAA